MPSIIRQAVLIMTVGAFAVLAPNASAVERVLEEKEIAKLAKSAETPAEHTQVAQQYLLRAKALEEKADKIERELRAERQGWQPPMATKWPAMVENTRERKERVAMQARRAAKESTELAAHHSKLAGKSLDQIATLSDD
jgi:hypothetical protein